MSVTYYVIIKWPPLNVIIKMADTEYIIIEIAHLIECDLSEG